MRWAYAFWHWTFKCIVQERFVNEIIAVITFFVDDDRLPSWQWLGNNDGLLISDDLVPCSWWEANLYPDKVLILVLSLAVALARDLRLLRLVLILLLCLWVRLSFEALSAFSLPCNPTWLGIHMKVTNFPCSFNWFNLRMVITRFIL